MDAREEFNHRPVIFCCSGGDGGGGTDGGTVDEKGRVSVLTKNGNYLIVNRLLSLPLLFSLSVVLSPCLFLLLSISFSSPSTFTLSPHRSPAPFPNAVHSPGCDRDTHRTSIRLSSPPPALKHGEPGGEA